LANVIPNFAKQHRPDPEAAGEFAKQHLRTTVQDPAGKVIRIFAKQHLNLDTDSSGHKKPPPFLMRVS
jgi:hypothetical protein